MKKYRKSDQEIEREKKRLVLISKFSKTYNKSVPNTILIKEFKKTKKKATIFGRITAKRDMGKSYFIDLMDSSGIIQLYINRKRVDNYSIQNLDLLDIGDFVATIGDYMLTKTKEESMRVERFWIVTKALLPLPNKFSKLKDPEEMVRKQYLSLLLDEKKRQIFNMRAKANSLVRDFFNKKGFLEVQTPHLHTLSTGALAKPFLTYHNALNLKMFLRIAPELHLKRLIAGNMGRIFEIARCFRNEGISNKHNPEFDLLEAYLPNESIVGVMNLVESLIKELSLFFWGNYKGDIKNRKFDFNKPFKKITMIEELKKTCNIDFSSITLGELKNFTKRNNINISTLRIINSGTIVQKIFEELIEPKLIDPTFVLGSPIEISPLAKKDTNNKWLASRFELFINGVEIANGYDEQNDPILQEEAFLKQREYKEKGSEEVGDFDYEYIEMLKHGLPPTGGLGVGLERLYAMFLNLNSIKDIILFPPIKSKST